MTKGKKFLFSFIALIFGTFLFAVFVHYQFVYSLPIQFIKFEEYPFIGNYIPLYLYWGSIIGMVFILLVILGIVLSPAEITSVKLNDDNGILEIKKSAIVGIVQSQLAQSNLLKDSKVNVKMYKKKIKVRITGNTSANLDIVNQTNQLVKNIELYLQTFIGLYTSIKAEVVFKNISRLGKNKQEQKRVI
ncbi:alkaline shock response membrane anchor protein AmaP [Enterococcus faecalis]|uniref:alkaline shock response membrane anchor protein AmaP n=1 Tax=Enterococcus faecalis TaxID=1351 RepID=UPI003512252B